MSSARDFVVHWMGLWSVFLLLQALWCIWKHEHRDAWPGIVFLGFQSVAVIVLATAVLT